MNLRCMYCQTPFTLARTEMLSAIITMNERNQTHYDAHCPRCRRANSIARSRMELFFPNWKEAAKHGIASEESAAPAPAAARPEPAAKEVKEKKKAPAEKKAAPAAAKKAPAAKPAAKTAAKPAAKSAEKKKAAPKK